MWKHCENEEMKEMLKRKAEELKDGKTVRRLWGTRIRKFGERWMANVLEVETLGSGHRTKITVEELK